MQTIAAIRQSRTGLLSLLVVAAGVLTSCKGAVVGNDSFNLIASGSEAEAKPPAAIESARHRRFIDAAAVRGGNGHSWPQAFRTLDEGLRAAASDPAITELWMAGGTYRPKGSGFHLTPRLRVIGGFRRGQKKIDQRDPAAAPTILDGRLPGGVRASHVVTAADGSVLDGLVIIGGAALGNGDDGLGGGVRVDGVSIEMKRCRIESNSALFDGGGIAVSHGSLLAADCEFISNEAWQGAGLNSDSSTVRLDRCRFIGNTANLLGGGLGSTGDSDIAVLRSDFSDNFAMEHGGGIWLNAGTTRVTACTMYGNASRWGGGLSSYRASVEVTCSVFLENHAVHAEIHGGAAINSHEGASPLRAINCTFVGNTSSTVAGAALGNQVHDLYGNCLFWGNRTDYIGFNAWIEAGSHEYSHCLLEGGFAAPWLSGPGMNIDLGGNVACDDPQFDNQKNPLGDDSLLGTADDGLHLLTSSPANAAGDPVLLPQDHDDLDGDGDKDEPMPLDVCGEERVTEGAVTIGAFQIAVPVGDG